jgi:hypothetical protein
VSHTGSSADDLPPDGHVLPGAQALSHPASRHHHRRHHHHCCCVHPAFAAVGDLDSCGAAAPALAGLHLLQRPSAAAAAAVCPSGAAAVACCCCAGHVEA